MIVNLRILVARSFWLMPSAFRAPAVIWPNVFTLLLLPR
jgi:hypothetical protein